MTEHLYNDDATDSGKEKPVANSVSGFDWEWIPSLERVAKDIHHCMANNHSFRITLNTQPTSCTVEFTLLATVASAKAQSSSETAGMMKDAEVVLTGDKKKAKVAIDRYGITSVRIEFKKKS